MFVITLVACTALVVLFMAMALARWSTRPDTTSSDPGYFSDGGSSAASDDACADGGSDTGADTGSCDGGAGGGGD